MSRSSIAVAVCPSTSMRVLALAAVAATLAACADQPTAPRAAPSPAASMNSRADAAALSAAAGPEWRRLFALREFNSTDRASKAAWSLATATNVRYHGGPVLQSGTNVVAIYWGAPGYANRPSGSGAGIDDKTLIGTFLRSLGGSAYFNINSTYTNAAGARIANVVNYTSYWSNDQTPPASPTDANIVAMLQNGISSGAIKYDASTAYAVLTGSGINLGGGFGTQYCAYHTHGTITDVDGVRKTILYSAMPYNYQYKSACTSGYAPANGAVDPAADYEVNTLALEIEETTTDMMGNAWYDAFGYENADKCAWTWGTTHSANGGVYNQTMTDKATGVSHNFLIQQNWVRTSPARCAQGY
jgi:hypothetical protein